MSDIMERGSHWFSVDPKSIEISVEMNKGKVVGKVLQGSGYPGGWKNWATKLRSLGIISCQRIELQEGSMGRKLLPKEFLMLRWGGTSDKVLDLHSLKSWAVLTWHLKRKLRMALMGGSLILFQFEKVVEEDKVLHLG
ncbi:hypothetical protein CK203_005180 [Vitis vinifera]|uniref:DUF4283 domain-containing protein n=1 Tax=Vitis vinifera TaxID=29760 RepID=A0A438KEK3_VITVI|nr:hypothetical protein CK203_005180 [Vitis vinifera]